MIMEISFGIVCLIGSVFVCKYTHSLIWIIIFMSCFAHMGSLIIDHFRTQKINDAMQSKHKVKKCGTYTGHSTILRGSHRNSWQQIIFHFTMLDGKNLSFPESDQISMTGSHFEYLENPPQSVCLTYAENYSDRFGYYFLTDIHFNKNLIKK